MAGVRTAGDKAGTVAAGSALDGSRISPGRERIAMASPLLVVTFGSIAARVSAAVLGPWAWIGTCPLYWALMGAIVLGVAGRSRAWAWYGPSRGSVVWPMLAVIVGLSAFPLLLAPNAGLLTSMAGHSVLWISFAFINGVMEEAFWRGFLLTQITSWPRPAVAVYSSALFVAIHFVMLGAFAPALFNVPFLLILIGITVIFTAMFIRTGSLRWPTAAHVLNDLGNMNIFVFMGLTVAF